MIKYKEILFIDFPETIDITEEVKEQNRNRVFTGGVRINNSIYRTKDEDEKYRTESLERKLP